MEQKQRVADLRALAARYRAEALACKDEAEIADLLNAASDIDLRAEELADIEPSPTADARRQV